MAAFANVKERNCQTARERILSVDARDSDVTLALYQLSDFLHRYYGKKVIILLDEYDTPMQEAYVSGYWDEMVTFIGSMGLPLRGRRC